MIDFYRNSGEGLPHYIAIIRKKQEDRGFVDGKHYGPHDLEVIRAHLSEGNISSTSTPIDDAHQFKKRPTVPSPTSALRTVHKETL
jgi:hypothetical protein